jgi:MFS family permease
MGTGWGLLLSSIAERGDEAWRWLFGLSSVSLVVFPLLALHLKESRAFRKGTPRPPLAAVLRKGLARYFWPMALLSFAVSAFTGPGANFILPRMVNDLGWDQGPASLVLVITSTPAVLLGLLIGGRAADLIGRKPTEFAAMVVGVSGGLAFYWFENGWILGLGIFGSVLGASAFSPAYSAQRAELFPTEVRATAGAWTVNASITGGLFGFLAGRFVIDAWGLSTTITVLGGVVLASAIMLTLLPETRGSDIIGADPQGPPGAMPM